MAGLVTITSVLCWFAKKQALSRLKHVVDINLDTIIDTLHNTNEVQIAPEEELNAFERNNPHPDGKRWCVAEQAIGNYYWGTHNITSNLEILGKFDRLDFHLPIHAK